jgi:amylosucrase
MVQVWSMLAAGDVVLTRRALGSLPPTPPSATWITYVRCHDDIGWAIDDADAASVGLNGFEHRRFLSDWYAGEHLGSWGSGLVFQHNPDTGDKRISGTAASLTGLADAADDAGEGKALARLFLAHAVVAGWGGLPVIWSGDEIGQGNDPGWAREPGHEGDNRWAHRPQLDWAAAERRSDLRTREGRVFQGLAHLARVRASLPQLHASADTAVLQESDPGLLVTRRQHPSGPIVGVYNVTDTWRPLRLDVFTDVGITAPHDALGDNAIYAGPDGIVQVSPYAAWWVVDASERPGLG